MNLGLCMVVRDEARNIMECLEPIVDLFEQIVIIDTGSTDGTPDLISTRLGIKPVYMDLDEAHCGCLRDVRNAGLETLSTPWVLKLDADERIDRRSVERICALPDEQAVAGYFGRWTNHIGDQTPFEDYKLFLFRPELRSVGLVHDNVQLDIRFRGQKAAWMDHLTVDHFPDPERGRAKTERYRWRLGCAIDRQPAFYRYYWHLGYMDFLAGHLDPAMTSLLKAAEADSRDFPVERLNSAMVLAEVCGRKGDRAGVDRILRKASTFYGEVADDFEVQVNFRLGDWLADAREYCRRGELTRVRAYRFAC